jgi:hypothetical protein
MPLAGFSGNPSGGHMSVIACFDSYCLVFRPKFTEGAYLLQQAEDALS